MRLLIACLEMDLLIGMAVIASSSMDEDAAYIVSMWALGGLACESVGLKCAINGSRLPTR